MPSTSCKCLCLHVLLHAYTFFLCRCTTLRSVSLWMFIYNNMQLYNMQFLYSALSSNELKTLYILLPPAHLDTPTPSQLLNGAYNTDTHYKWRRYGWSMYNSFLCALPGFHFTAEWTGAHSHFGYKSCPGTLGTEDWVYGEPTISWLRVHCLNQSANGPPSCVVYKPK